MNFLQRCPNQLGIARTWCSCRDILQVHTVGGRGPLCHLKCPTREFEIFFVMYYMMAMVIIQKRNIMLNGWLANTTGLINSCCPCQSWCQVQAHDQ